MFKKLLVLLGLMILPSISFAGGIDILKSLIPNRVGIDYAITSDSYSIPMWVIDSCHIQPFNRALKMEDRDPDKFYWDYNFAFPSVSIDAETEIGIGASLGLEIYKVGFHVGFYSIIGTKEHEGDKGYRSYIKVKIF